MNKKTFLFLGLLIVTMLATTVSFALATKPISVSGTWIITPGLGDIKVAGNSDIQIRTSTNGITLTGSISGTGTSDHRQTFHFNPSFFVTSQWDITVEATIDGNSGILYIKAFGNSQKLEDGNWIIIRGTDDLANIHGQGTFDHVTPSLFTYEGQIHFDP